jgi:hypothetical protein
MQGINGEIAGHLTKLNVKPGLTPAQAVNIAYHYTEQQHNLASAYLNHNTPELRIYDRVLIEDTPFPIPHLAWLITINSSLSQHSFQEELLIDAHSGQLLFAMPHIHGAFSGEIYDVGGKDVSSFSPEQKVKICSSTDTSTDTDCDPDPDAQRVDKYMKDFYDFFENNYNRDSIDGKGTKLIAVVNHGKKGAFFSSDKTIALSTYSRGYVSQDVVGHEFLHGINAHTSELIYYGQSGAIDESLADVFGEFIDLLVEHTNADNDLPEKRWLIGEDLPSEHLNTYTITDNNDKNKIISVIKAIRSLSDPTIFDHQPEKMSDYKNVIDDSDNGGVHTNSGINNKAAYLMVHPQAYGNDSTIEFNGQSITGVSGSSAEEIIKKVSTIYYRAQTAYLTEGANYKDLYFALNQSCKDLINFESNNITYPVLTKISITEADCKQVNYALTAVEMNQFNTHSTVISTNMTNNTFTGTLNNKGDSVIHQFTLPSASQVIIRLSGSDNIFLSALDNQSNVVKIAKNNIKTLDQGNYRVYLYKTLNETSPTSTIGLTSVSANVSNYSLSISTFNDVNDGLEPEDEVLLSTNMNVPGLLLLLSLVGLTLFRRFITQNNLTKMRPLQ